MALYARQIVLRNCGRFTVIQSDFGADYRTHIHVTVQALYASLTRGATWRPQPIILKKDRYDFERDYDLDALPLWFIPGIFRTNVQEEAGNENLPQDKLDSSHFNVLHELYPTTSGGYSFDKKTGQLKTSKRPQHVLTYGTWQAILPNCRLVTYAFSSERKHLDDFTEGQTYLLGKKRTMMQVVRVGKIMSGVPTRGSCLTPYLQVTQDDIPKFQSFEVLAGTLRYLILRGETLPETNYLWFSDDLMLPQFAVPDHLHQQEV